MSSPSRIWSDRHPVRAAVLLLAVVAAQCAATGTGRAAPSPAGPDVTVPLPVSAVHTGGGETSLVVDLSASTRAGPRTVSVTLGGLPQPARLTPVVSDDLAVALVVDASAAGAAMLPDWLSAGAWFMLEAPAGTRAVVVADTAPARLVAGPQRGPMEAVRALHGVRAGGGRDTAAALTLAAGRIPDNPAGARVILLYTSATDAGGEDAAALAARLRASGTLLVVVGVADAGRYWADAAAATGGFFAPAGDPDVVPALEQVRATLDGRHLVRFSTPPTLPARVSVRVGTGDLTLTGDAVIPAPDSEAAPAAPAPPPASRTPVVVAAAVAAGLLVAVVVALLVTRRRRRRPADWSEPTSRIVHRPTRAGGPPGAGEPTEAGTPDRAATPAGAGAPSDTGTPAAAASPSAARTPEPAGTRPAETHPAAAEPPVARGRVSIPPAVARGRATVPRRWRPPAPIRPAAERDATAPARRPDTPPPE